MQEKATKAYLHYILITEIVSLRLENICFALGYISLYDLVEKAIGYVIDPNFHKHLKISCVCRFFKSPVITSACFTLNTVYYFFEFMLIQINVNDSSPLDSKCLALE